ncbi:MAG TPA: hypothetical protein PKA19_06265 [Bacillota bacterium]|nr:hypothetical protein [Bacillota bacterium]
MADVHCPMGMIRPMADCMTCGNNITGGTSLEWCGYKVPPPPAPQTPPELPINALTMQMKRKLGKAEYFYRIGKPRIGDSLSDEAAWIERKIRRIKKDEQRKA